jgi:hypothetical protein
MMNIQQYIQSEIEGCAQYQLNDEDKKFLNEHGVEDFIYKKLTSKKFRKWKVDELSEKQVKNALNICVSENKPIQFRYPFGGYKLWRLPSSPEVDWAEFFAIAYYCRYLAPIAAAYGPGIELKFASDDLIIERMDNIPTSDTDRYFESFKELLMLFKPKLPSNMKVEIVRISDLYPDKVQMEKELEVNVEKQIVEYRDNISTEKKQAMYTMSELNIKWDGSIDLTDASESKKDEIIKKGPVYHDAYCSLSKRREFNRGDDKVVLFTTPIPNALAIGTTRGSVTKYWTGFGVLLESEKGFSARVLSPKQLELNTEYGVEDSPLKGTSLNNLNQIRVYKKIETLK